MFRGLDFLAGRLLSGTGEVQGTSKGRVFRACLARHKCRFDFFSILYEFNSHILFGTPFFFFSFSSSTRLLPQYVHRSRFHLVGIANSSTYSLTISRPPPLTTHAAMGKFLAIAVSLLAALTAVTSAPVPYSESEVERMRSQGRSEVCAMLPYIDRTVPSPSPPDRQQRFLSPSGISFPYLLPLLPTHHPPHQTNPSPPPHSTKSCSPSARSTPLPHTTSSPPRSETRPATSRRARARRRSRLVSRSCAAGSGIGCGSIGMR